MAEDTNRITADNLRADFLNATTNWDRWRVLNLALDWALAATENANRERGKTATMMEALTAAQSERDRLRKDAVMRSM